ncbi:MAG: SDR family NAD(P)-dependent oxidoreductase [Acidimicrobiales bacterium]
MSTLAVITGASRGIGAGIARAATDGGAVVAGCNRSPSSAEHDLSVDLADPGAWSRFAEWYEALLDTVQPDDAVFVHNAATLTPIGFAGEVDPDGYRSNVLLNSAAPQVLGDAVIRAARRHHLPTVVVQLTSGAGKNPYPGWTSYCAAKAAVDMWVRSVGVEQAQRPPLVRAVAVSPGVVATEMQAEIRASTTDTFPNVERFRDLHDGGRLADPNEVGAELWALARSGHWDNGAVLDLSA